MKSVKITVILLLMMSLCSCGGAVEINELAFIMGVGVDKVDKSGNYKVTAQIAKAAALKSSSTGGDGGDSGNDNAYVNLTHEGKGIYAPLHSISQHLSRKLYTGHNQIFVVGSEVAKDDMAPVLDYFVRSSEGRFTISLLVANDKASDIFDKKIELESLPAMFLENLLYTQRWYSVAENTTVSDFLNAMMSRTTAATIPLISAKPDKDSEGKENGKKESKDESSEDEGKDENKISLDGTAVFNGSKMTGKLSPGQTRAMLLLRDKAKDGVVELVIPGGYTSFEIIHSKTKIKPIYENGNFKIKAEISQTCSLMDTMLEEDLLSRDMLGELESLAEKNTIEMLEDAVLHAKEINADVFGFGDAIYKKYPRRSKHFIDNWEKEFKNLEVEFDVKIKIADTGAVTLPLKPHTGNAMEEKEYVGK